MIKHKDLSEFTKKLNILYIESENQLRKKNSHTFKNFFKGVTSAVDGKDGLKKYIHFYKKNGVYHDIVLTDVIMPNMDGYQLIDEIHNINPGQAIIVISEYPKTSVLIKLIDQGIGNFVPKPINDENLISVLYKVSKNITNEKFAKTHAMGIKKFNKILKQRVKEEIKKNTKKEIQIIKQANALSKEYEIQKHKDMFLANMSHEIRTPLNGIIGFMNILKETTLTQEQTKYVNLIYDSSKILSTVINDILDFSKIAEGKLELNKQPTNCKIGLSKLLSIFELRIKEKDLKFIVDIDPSLPDCVICDQDRINQIIMNLMGNAIKFTEEGSVEFRAALFSETDDLVSIKYSIKDTGIGIAKDKQKLIFQAFSQEDKSTSTKFGGTGLGVSIANGLVKLAGGKLKLKSTVGEGSEFYFVLKFKICKKAIMTDTGDISTDLYKFDKVHILVAEDNLINQELIENILTAKNIKITIANNGQETIDLYENNTNKFDMIFMDINMPVVSGLKALAKIREFEKINDIKNISIVALTANTIKGDKEKYIKLGMDDYLSKPIDTKKLNKVLMNFLGGSTTDGTSEDKEVLVEKVNDTIEAYSIKNVASELETDEAIIDKLLNKFFDKINIQIKEIYELVEQEKFDKLHSVLHAIKGTSGNLRLNYILDLTSMLEKHSKNKDTNFQWNKHLKLLERYVQEYKNILKEQTHHSTKK